MFDKSFLSSGHHFYLTVLETPGIKNIDQLVNVFAHKKESELLRFKNTDITHLQIALQEIYGSDTVLNGNKIVYRNQNYYWYDFYMGRFKLHTKSVFFICYPYKALGKFIDHAITEHSNNRLYFRAKVPDILKYMKTRGWAAEIKNLEKEGHDISITKYSAQIMEEPNAKKLNLIGSDPLNSRIYDILSSISDVAIEPVSLRLKCYRHDEGELELAFDKIGNFRFWLRKNSQDVCLPIIPYIFNFLSSASALENTSFIVSQTYLEDE